MFDVISIGEQGGKGGTGAVSFRREKFVPFGGPDGGDGGNGGNVIIRVDPAVTSFKEFRQKGWYRAKDGENGNGQKKSGKRGEDLVIKVPVGTVVYEEGTEGSRVLLADLSGVNEAVMVAKGGGGGWGNVHYATSTNQTPRLAQVGEAGEKKSLVLELRLIADVGIIGYPNVGKSSLLAAASAAKPRIADYPFTTKEPELGVVMVGHNPFVLAEIPGLIEGAHQGKGLGHDFLRHSTRTKVFIHLIDGSSESPVEDMIKVNNELSLYDPSLAKKPQIVVVNKVDLPEVRERIEDIREDFTWIGAKVQFVSAATGEGVRDLMKAAYELLKKVKVSREAVEPKVFHPQPKRRVTEIGKEGNVFVINAPDIERIIMRVDMNDPTIRWQVRGYLMRKGIGRELEKAGIKGGDEVRCGNAEWEW
ncbi:MAG TPA: GTPase ObgE [Dehalococcoidales bacterium]